MLQRKNNFLLILLMPLDHGQRRSLFLIGAQILSEALKLPHTERAELIENLLSSFEFPSRKIIDALWAQEAESRIDASGSGKESLK